MNPNEWTDQELDRFVTLWNNGVPEADIAEMLDRTLASIKGAKARARARGVHLTKRLAIVFWSQEETEIVLKHVGQPIRSWMHLLPNRSYKSIKHKIYDMGISNPRSPVIFVPRRKEVAPVVPSEDLERPVGVPFTTASGAIGYRKTAADRVGVAYVASLYGATP